MQCRVRASIKSIYATQAKTHLSPERIAYAHIDCMKTIAYAHIGHLIDNRIDSLFYSLSFSHDNKFHFTHCNHYFNVSIKIKDLKEII